MIVLFIYSFIIRIKFGFLEIWIIFLWCSVRFDFCFLYKYVENVEGIVLFLCFIKYWYFLIDEY